MPESRKTRSQKNACKPRRLKNSLPRCYGAMAARIGGRADVGVTVGVNVGVRVGLGVDVGLGVNVGVTVGVRVDVGNTCSVSETPQEAKLLQIIKNNDALATILGIFILLSTSSTTTRISARARERSHCQVAG